MSSAVAAESARRPGWNGTEQRRPRLGVGDGVPAGDGTLGDHIYPPMGAGLDLIGDGEQRQEGTSRWFQ